MKKLVSTFKLVDGGMGTNLKKIGWNDIPVKAPFEIENKVHKLFATCDTFTTNTFAIDAAYAPNEWSKVFNKSLQNALKNAGQKQILISISELANREHAKILLTALTSAIKKVSDKNKNLMILFETFTSINTVHIMMSELDKLSCDIKYKSCIVSGTYNFRTLNDGTTPKQFATYCNRYDFIKVIGQNCCDVSTDIPYILSEYKKVSNKFIFCKPNTDAVTLDELSGYLRKFNCLYGGFCCGATSALTGGLGKKLHNFSVRSSKTNNATYAMEILPQGAIVGDRINTTKNSKLTTWLANKNWEEIARLALTQKAYGADLIDVNISCPQEEKIIAELFTYLQENTDCKFIIDSSNVNAIQAALKVYKGVPIINSINFDTPKTILQKFELYRPIYVFMTMANGVIRNIGKHIPSYLTPHNAYIDCCVESLDVNPNAFVDLNKRINSLPYDQYRVLLGISNLSHHFIDRKIIDCAAYESLKNKCAFIAKVDNVKYFSKTIDVLHNIPDIKRLEKIEDYIINGILPSSKILSGFLTSMSKKEIETKVLESLNFIGMQFEKRTITTYNLQASAKVCKLIFNEIFPVSKNAKPEVIIATVEGDFHDIGKTIVCSLMSAHKISFVDLGVNVGYEKIAKTLSSNKDVKIIGLSGLIYPSIDQAKKIIDLIHKNYPKRLVYVGGAVFDKAIATKIKADGYFATALESVNQFVKILKK